MVTQRSIAEKMGVSQRLVAYALTGNGRMSEETRQRICEEAERLGYRPNRAAQALVTGRTYQIALSLRLLGSSFGNHFLRAFEALLRDSSYDLLIASHKALEKSNISADGLIFYGWLHQTAVTSSLPQVQVIVGRREDLPAHGAPNCDLILLDLAAASRDAMQHYLEQGCRRILYVAGKDMTQSFEPRYAAYNAAMQAADLPLETLFLEMLEHEDHVRDQAHRQLREYFAANGFPEALFCSNDDIAAGAYRALREAGRSIPQQTAVLGCDDLESSKDLSPPLTSIHIPFEEISQRAWELLQLRLQDPQRPPQHAEFKATLVVRESSQRQEKPK